MGQENGSKKSSPVKRELYVPPNLRNKQQLSGNVNITEKKIEEKRRKSQLKFEKEEEAGQSEGYKVRMPPGMGTSADTPSKKIEESVRTLNIEVPINCCEDEEMPDVTERADTEEEAKVAEKPQNQFVPRQLVVADNQNGTKNNNSPGKNKNRREKQEKVAETRKIVKPLMPAPQPSQNHSEVKPSQNRTISNLGTEFTEKEFLSVNVPFIDSHCHTDFIYSFLKSRNGVGLDFWRERYPRAFPQSFAGCIVNFISPSLFTDEPGSQQFDIEWIVQELNSRSYVGSTWGCHPHHASKYCKNAKFWSDLETYLNEKDRLKVVAVGEAGVDLHKCESSVHDQIEVFRRQVQLAYRYDLALVIHCRSGQKGDAEQYCLNVLEEEMRKPEHHRYLRIHRHCYTENWDNAHRWIEMCPNIVFGFTPAVFNFKEPQFEAIRRIPLDRIVLETDAPYFKPRALEDVSPPKCSLPGIAAATAFKIAEIKRIPVEEVLRVTYCNTHRIYQLPLA